MNTNKIIRNIGVLLLIHLALLSCTQEITKDNITIYKDIVYTNIDGKDLKLDIAVPNFINSPSPAIIDIPGGAWLKAEKRTEDAIFYAKHGFIGISITYRTSDIAIFPAAVHDCKTAVRWVRANANRYNINPDKIGVTGVSAGGYLATILGTSGGNKYLEGNGNYIDFSSEVQAVVDHFGPTDFLQDIGGESDYSPGNSPGELFIGGSLIENIEQVRLANPITYIDKNDPPIFIGHGELDGMVKIEQSEILYEALKKANIPTKFVRVENADHMYIANKWDEEIDPTIDDLFQYTIEWFEKWLGKPDINKELIIKEPESNFDKTYENQVVYYKLNIELPGKTKESYCKGRYAVMCDGKTLASGLIDLTDLSIDQNRIFQKEIKIKDIDLTDKLILWNFRGEIFDSDLNKTFEPGFLQNEKYNKSIKGIGFDIKLEKGKSVVIKKKVYRN